ncbi:MAG: trehalose-phosphatase [Planctomycetota bacterium]
MNAESDFQAVLLDLDGVLTRTAAVHARAWKEMFDAYLQQRGRQDGTTYAPFDIERDYRQYVDGKPRYDGVRSFLRSRGIDVPEGDDADPPDRETIQGLGNRKNELYRRHVSDDGVEVFDDAVRRIRRWRGRGLRTAIISSSRNCQLIVETAGATDLFDARVDGNDVGPGKLDGKPHPAMFVEAARRVGADPQRCAVVEDAESGVEAGRRGGFGLVIGVARDKPAEPLRRHGADLVVGALDEVGELETIDRTPVPDALEHRDALARQLDGAPPALFLDYDGTLTPIVPRPEDAIIDDAMRQAVRRLAERCPVAVVSGRDTADVRGLVGLDELTYAGSHGFDIVGPDVHQQQPDAQAALAALDDAQGRLEGRLANIDGAQVERKRYAIAVHYRNAAASSIGRIEQAVDDALAAHAGLRKRGGKKIFELLPDVDWDKGRAVQWLREALGLSDRLPVYIGDDVTDEDAFRRLDEGIGIRVGPPDQPTAARYVLADTEAVREFLAWLLEQLAGARTT